ncbi:MULTISPECIES: LysR family transcriptional regulator [unclassified Nocardia]|uniref:LysR family transcriptional regulator n=1 Tax=unclassified Nocardia TaxID=2637762 RepID=UPI00342DEA55
MGDRDSDGSFDLNQLRTFLAVHRAGSITAGARLVGLSQPTVTTQLPRARGRSLLRWVSVPGARRFCRRQCAATCPWRVCALAEPPGESLRRWGVGFVRLRLTLFGAAAEVFGGSVVGGEEGFQV